MSWNERIRSPGTPLPFVTVRLRPEAIRKLDLLAHKLATEHGVRVSRGRAIEMMLEGEFDE